MKKEKFGSGRDIRNHISETERKRNRIIYILMGILVAIFLLVVIIMFPRVNHEKQADDAISQADSSMIESTGNNKNNDKNRVVRDENKVEISVDLSSLTEYYGVITIVDKNEVPYTWTPRYKLQQYVDGEWEDMILQNIENDMLSDTEIENPTGTMTQSLVWGNKYGELKRGEKYRIVKETEGKEFYAEFKLP